MTINLPTNPAPASAEPFLLDFSVVQQPFLGGPVSAHQRIGTRLGLRVTMPPMRGAVARQFQSRLMLGKKERVRLEWPLLDLDPGAPPDPKIKVNSTGTALSLKGLGAGYTIQEGQPLSVGGLDLRIYMHIATGDVTANGFGEAVVSVWPPARVVYVPDCVVLIQQPVIEGLVLPGDELSWSYALEHTMGFAFSVVETK